MADHEHKSPPMMNALYVLAIIVTLIIAILVMRNLPESSRRDRGETAPPVATEDTAARAPGVRLELRQGDVVVERVLPTANFALEPGETLDPRVAPGPFTATLRVPVDADRGIQARVGAHLEGGGLIVRHGNEPVLTDVRERSGEVLSGTVVALRGADELVYEVSSKGDRRVAMRAIWQPLGADVPRPLAVSGSRPAMLADVALRGRILATELGCVACHQSEVPERQRRLAAQPGPDLGRIGARARPSWLRRWLSGPHAVKPGTRMPDVGHDGMFGPEVVENLVHYLATLGGPIDLARTITTDEEIAHGKILYHRVGCVACHDALVPPEALPEAQPGAGKTWGAYASLGEPAAKTTRAALAAFLRDPVATRPSGVMPGMELTGEEADHIAAYLMTLETALEEVPDVAVDQAFRPDPDRVAGGRAVFEARGCANCHSIGPDSLAMPSSLEAPPLETLAARPKSGCLAPKVPRTALDFALTSVQRFDLRAFLARLAECRSERVPTDDLVADIHRLRCTACHAFETARGPERALRPYFVSSEEADLGNEGRLPPRLTDAGGRLTTAWVREMLEGQERARPYMATRMPDYGGANVAHLPDLLAAAAGATAVLDGEPTSSSQHIAGGRTMIGDQGLNCIQCHMIAGSASTGTPGPDLALMPGRLRYDYFRRWLRAPERISPGTRMPTFYFNGYSAVRDVHDGRAADQIASMWCYLAQGETLALPEGLVDPGAFELVVADEPIVFRTFIEGAGVRAIACGFPEQVHCAFDAERCQTVLAWDGAFLSAAGAWGARGGSETNPESVAWTAPTGMLVEIVADEPSASETTARFREYRLDQARRPIFTYVLSRGGTDVRVTEQPLPHPERPRTLLRRFETQGTPGVRLRLRGGPGAAFAGDAQPGGDGATVTLGADGRASWTVEVSW